MRKLILLYSICIALFTACGDSVVSPEQIEKFIGAIVAGIVTPI